MSKSDKTTTIFITRKVPEVAFQLLHEEGFTVDLWDKETPPTQEEL